MLNELFKTALVVGMQPEDYWNGDPEWLWAYVEVYNNKIHNEQKSKNMYEWLQGVYIQKAIASCIDSKNCKYPNEPLDIFPKTEEEIEEEKDKKLYKVKEQLNDFAARFKKK